MTSERPDDTSRGTRRRPAWAVGSIAAAVLLAGGGTAYWASTAYGDGGSGHRTADSAASAPRDAGDPSGPGIAPGEPDPSGEGVVYRTDVKLPEAPAKAPAYALSGEITSAEVARLAAALGLPGEPRLNGDVWVAGEAADGSGPRLTVARSAPGTWNFARFQAPVGGGSGAGDDCARGKDTCGPATLPQDPGASAGGGAETGKPVSEEAAKAAAAPVLAAAGVEGARQDARMNQGSVRVVAADPVVGGLPTQGWSTKVSVGSDGAVVGANGELKAPVRAADQQVVGAVEALARLNARSGGREGNPEPSGCASAVPLSADVPAATDAVPCNPEPRPMKPPRTETVKGAVLGLVPGTVNGARGLVPAWLFEVAGQGGAPGHTVAQPAAAQESTPGPGSKDARTVTGFSYAEAGRKLTVNFWAGACSTYALEARESADSVVVKITDTPNKPGQACIMLAQEMSLTATLEQPLGDRKVIDATTGKPIPRQ
ncbi:hypothetical protein DEJ51_09020 [Streptomyces venezuelae]|uniref:Large membrane protein n=1 Tax=Streptomyces venezuelae TaxID=54571 RepID=A0A5P2DGY4_STRVZ|nr:hypothetical protein [Streptomyces venezuelae]QES54366.1 hypothetical protein DEJ51_09020 [Streptomyces venezuelae]